ncbi:unnamed protein product [Caenorhabditis brenneri]
MKFALFLALYSGLVLADPQIVWLNKYNVDSPNSVITVETGGKLYLASNDALSQLQKIKVQTGTSVFTLDQLMVANGITLLSNQLTVTSTIDQPTAATITGYLYTTTAIQANDNTFDVTIVSGPQNVHKTGPKSTLVVLNTQFTTTHFPPFDAPEKTTYVTNVTQDTNTDLNFHYGFPGVDWNTFTENQFFENPQYIANYDNWGRIYNKTRLLFDSVEPIQVNLPYWYITANGPFDMILDSIYNNLHTHNTTNARTTGAYVLTDVWQDHDVNFATDPTRQGYTGVLVTTDLQYSVVVTFSDGFSKSVQTYGGNNPLLHAQVITDMASKTLHIEPTAIYAGTMYLQYFVYTGDLLPTTLSPPTQSSTVPMTTPTIATTTRFTSFANSVLNNVESGARLYVASNDNNQYLKNITVASGATSITLDKLSELNDDGTPKSIQINGNVVVSTSNNDSTTGRLSGYLYITTKLQADDPRFSVFVIKTANVISSTVTNSTTVILNTALRGGIDGDQPSKTSYVTNIEQPTEAKIRFHWGIPQADWNNNTNNTFFRNPIELKDENETYRVFFNNVEPLQVGLNYWYITAMGPFSMKLENKYVSNHNYTTTAVNTTGILVNRLIYQKHVVNFTPDTTRSGICGAFVSAYIDNDYLGIFLNYQNQGQISDELNNTSETQTYFFTYEQGTRLTVISGSMAPGDFYIQYFSFSGALYPSTTEAPTTSAPTTVTQTGTPVSTTTVATTTKGATVLLETKLWLLIVLFVLLL